MEARKLILSPHADDEVLGCGGILDNKTHVFYCGINEDGVANKDKHRISMEKRKNEIESVAKFFGFSYSINKKNLVNHYTVNPLINQIEKIINEIKPERIYIPFPSYNQDHKIVYDASRIALRPHDKNWFVKKVLTYEQPHSVIWNNLDFSVQYFVPINIEKKIEGYLLHKSQVRKFRSPEIIEALAKLRGASIGIKYAEAYKIERWVE